MMYFRFAIIFFLLISFSVKSQLLVEGLNDYTPLQNDGQRPASLTPSLERVKKCFKRYKLYGASVAKKHSQRYYDWIQSGEFYYGNELSDYISKVGKSLLTEETEEIKNGIHFHVVKSNTNGSFAMLDSNVYITIGLLAQLESESQLAFVLAQEIEKIINKVPLNHIVIYDLDYFNPLPKRSKVQDDDNTYISHFKRNFSSTEDENIIKRVINSGYSKKNIEYVVGAIRSSSSPLHFDPFDVNYLNSKYLLFDSLFLTEQEIPIEEFEKKAQFTEDEEERIDRLIKFSLNTVEKTAVINDPISFNFFKTIAQFELINFLLFQNEIEQALINIYYLQKKYPDNIFLEKQKCIALYLAAKLSDEMSVFKVDEYLESFDYSRQFYYFFQVAKPVQKIALALEHIVRLSAIKQDEHLDKMALDLMELLISDYNMKLSDFYEDESEIKVIVDTLIVDYNANKYKQIRVMREKFRLANKINQECLLSGFIELRGNSKFDELFLLASKNHLSKMDSKPKQYKDLSSFLSEQDSVCLVNTNFIAFSRRYDVPEGDRKFRFSRTKRINQHLVSDLKEINSVPQTLPVNYHQFNKGNSSAYDEINKFVQYSIRNRSCPSVVPINYNELLAAKKELGYSTFGQLNMVGISTFNNFNKLWILGAFMAGFYPGPVVTAINYAPYWSVCSEYFFVDLNTYKISYYEIITRRGKPSRSFLKSMINQQFYISKK